MNDALSLAGKVAIVTGAGNGLGRAESVALARAGALLVLNDLPGDAVAETAALIAAAGGEAVVRAGDIGDWETGEGLVRAALDAYGRLDILVNNAGVLRDRMVFTMSAEEWDTVIRVHLRGHFVTTHFATAHWREASKRRRRPGLRADREHLVGGVPARLARPAELRRGQGRHRGPHGVHRARLRAVRRPRQRHLPARPHRHARRAGEPAARGRSRPARPRARDAAGDLPGEPRGGDGSTARCSSCTAASPR